MSIREERIKVHESTRKETRVLFEQDLKGKMFSLEKSYVQRQKKKTSNHGAFGYVGVNYN